MTAVFISLLLPVDEADARRGRRGGYSSSSKSYHVKTRKKSRRGGARFHYGRRSGGWRSAATLVALGAVGIAAMGVGATVAAVAGGLNVRSAPHPRSRVLDTLAYGEEVTVKGIQGDWVEVETADGKTGYAHASYLGQAAQDDEDEIE